MNGKMCDGHCYHVVTLVDVPNNIQHVGLTCSIQGWNLGGDNGEIYITLALFKH